MTLVVLNKLRALIADPLMRGAIWSFWIRLLLMGTGFLTSVVLGRTLGPEGFGLYSYAMAIATIAATMAGFGLQGLAIRELAIFNANLNWPFMRGFLKFSVLSIVVGGLIIAAILLAVGQLSIENHDQRDALFWVAALVPAGALYQYGEAVFRSQGRAVLSQIPELFIRRFGFLVAVIASTYFLQGYSSPKTAVAFQFVVTAFGLLYFVIYSNRLLPAMLKAEKANYDYAKWMKGAAPFLATSFVFVANDQLGVLVIESLSDMSVVGFYRVAFRAAELVVLVRGVADIVLQPKFAFLYSSNRYVELQRLLKMSARMTTIAAFIVGALLYFFRNEFLWIYGESFKVAGVALSMLIVSQVLAVIVGPVVSLLAMSGFQFQVLLATVFGTVINLILCIYLVPVYGLEGAAFATAVGMIIPNFLLMLFIKRRLGFSSHVF